MLGNVLLLKKTDAVFEKKILNCASKGNYYHAIWNALHIETKRNRFFLVASLFFSMIHKINMSIVLRLFILFDSKKKTWLEYVLQTKSRSLTKVALSLVSNDIAENEFIVDIGCGTGEILSLLSNHDDSENIYLGIDKSLYSLVLGSALFSRSHFFILFDVDESVPLQSTVVTRILLCDTFPWIKNKEKHLNELVRIMKPKARAYIINIHAKLYQEKIKSFGISPINLNRFLNKKFHSIIFDHCSMKILRLYRQRKKGFSCIIEKK